MEVEKKMNFKGHEKIVNLRSNLTITLDQNEIHLFEKVTSPDNILPEGMELTTSIENNVWSLTLSGSFSLGRLKNTLDEIIQHLILISRCNNLIEK